MVRLAPARLTLPAVARRGLSDGLGVTFPCSRFPQVAVYGLIFYSVPLTLKHRLCRRNQMRTGKSVSPFFPGAVVLFLAGSVVGPGPML